MKTLFTICVVLISMSAFAQKFGTYEIETEGTFNENTPVYEVWLRQESWVTMKFRQNPMGLKHLIEMGERILDANGMLDEDPTNQDSTIGSDVEDSDDNEQLHNSIQRGNSELRVVYLKDGRLLQFFATEDGYEINVLNPY